MGSVGGGREVPHIAMDNEKWTPREMSSSRVDALTVAAPDGFDASWNILTPITDLYLTFSPNQKIQKLFRL